MWRDLAERPPRPLDGGPDPDPDRRRGSGPAATGVGARSAGDPAHQVRVLKDQISELQDQLKEMEAQGGVRVVAEALDLVDALQVELAERDAANRADGLAASTSRFRTARGMGGGGAGADDVPGGS